LAAFREQADRAGSGYQTMINQALREYLGQAATPLDEETLRKVLREELQATG
ncbi:MAG: BrnA antitoxin family protein, partial [bacterium]|nr:BrnA antitoxin family protein [bacterium]